MEKIFCVNVKRYKKDSDFEVYYPASLDRPKDNSVTFLTSKNIDKSYLFGECKNCLIFWPQEHIIPDNITGNGHVFVTCQNPHLRFCEFFEENNISNMPKKEQYNFVNGAYICNNAHIGKDVLIQPGAYISGESVIGDHSYIGCGVKIVGSVKIGKNVIIRENTVIGADGLTTDRKLDGKPVKMPQFGGVIIGNNVTIGANSVIARGAIDDTIIGDETAIDNCVFVSHNVKIGNRVFIVGESILFGSSKVGNNVMISGNVTVRNGVNIGDNSLIGMGSVVVRDVSTNTIVKGNPAK